MTRRRPVLNTLVLALAAFASVTARPSAASDCPLTNKDLADIGILTKVIAIPKINVSAAEYKSDGDPATLELVFLSDKNDGPSRVSDDGEIIFLQGEVYSDLLRCDA